MLPIISVDQRLNETKGIKGCIFGKSGIGKTSLLWTLPEESTLFIDLEAGDLPVKEWKGASLRPSTWQTLRDLAVYIAGYDPALGDKEVTYSKKHYEAVRTRWGDPKAYEKYTTLFIDSISQASNLSFRYCSQQPEAISRNGSVDTRAIYGLHGKEMLGWIRHLQRAREKNIWLVGILDKKLDDHNLPVYSFQIEGNKTGLELSGIVDEVLIMTAVIDPEDPSRTVRKFLCHADNIHDMPAKDRSGALDLYEKPNLGHIMHKIVNSPRPTATNFTYQ
ncbi:ATP-binding protein [Candidatus Liberibacter sp.]|uniref:ATP-binding protein n=2 Tax=Candidatus Liberibacter sp. TaxID=34022 RepID=UPI0015F36F9B|nr:ATP-binding protein [Candidatus Liberibacter sp.]MBA5724596.1 ATP-binding protein [Candidatus Liberibacter sp.]